MLVENITRCATMAQQVGPCCSARCLLAPRPARPPMRLPKPAPLLHAVRRGQRSQLCCRASATIKEESTGVQFPEVTQFWAGEQFRCLGAGFRAKKIAFIGVKVYAVALYVEAEKAARELAIRDRGGFFADASDEDYATAITDGAFDKLLQVQLVRTVDGQTFFEALEKHLAPRLRLTGGTDALKEFGDFLLSKSLEKGTDVVMLWRGSDNLEVVLRQAGSDLSKVEPDLRLQSVPLCRGLFETFLGGDSVVPDARAKWAAGARKLLESERVRRDTRPGGFG